MPKTNVMLLVKLIEWEARGKLMVEEDTTMVEEESVAEAAGGSIATAEEEEEDNEINNKDHNWERSI